MDEGKDAFKGCVLLRTIRVACGYGRSLRNGQWRNKSLSCCCVDIGRSAKADYSVITVFDRFYMMDGDKPEICCLHNGMDTQYEDILA